MVLKTIFNKKVKKDLKVSFHFIGEDKLRLVIFLPQPLACCCYSIIASAWTKELVSETPESSFLLSADSRVRMEVENSSAKRVALPRGWNKYKPKGWFTDFRVLMQQESLLGFCHAGWMHMEFLVLTGGPEWVPMTAVEDTGAPWRRHREILQLKGTVWITQDKGQVEAELDIVEGRVSRMEAKTTKGPLLRHRWASEGSSNIWERGAGLK